MWNVNLIKIITRNCLVISLNYNSRNSYNCRIRWHFFKYNRTCCNL